MHRGPHHARRDDPPAGYAARRRRDSRDKRHARCQPICRAIAEDAGIEIVFCMISNYGKPKSKGLYRIYTM